MNGNEFLEKLELINPEFVEAADIKPKRKKYTKIKWTAIAASLCLIILAGVWATDYFNLFDTKANNHKVTVQHAAAGFNLNGNDDIVYFPIPFDDCKRYGIIPQDAIGLSRDDAYEITSDDIGEHMGTVTSCGDKTLVGRNVYHYSKFSNYDSICIVDTNEGYEFYTGTIFIGKYSNLSSNECLAMFRLPDSLEKIEIIDDKFNVLYEIKDEKNISSFFNIILNKYDIGSNEMNRRRADAWYKEYGNDDLYYDETTGKIVYKYENEIIKEGYTSIIDGVEIVFEPQFGDTVTRDKAIELWNRNCVNISLTSNNGFGITIEYSPITSTFSISGNDYSLTEAEIQELNALLQIMN